MFPKITHKLLYKLTLPLFVWLCLVTLPLSVSAAKADLASGGSAAISAIAAPKTTNLGDPVGGYSCGGTGQEVRTAINIGCAHKGNPILDALFAIIRILSVGVGLAIVTGLIIAGIQLTASKGDPQLRAKAISRIYNVVIALFVYIFAYAILNYVIPVGFFS